MNDNRWNRLLILIAAAAICYFLGFSAGAVLFITLGAAFELAFWIQLFRRQDSRPDAGKG